METRRVCSLSHSKNYPIVEIEFKQSLRKDRRSILQIKQNLIKILIYLKLTDLPMLHFVINSRWRVRQRQNLS